jgi:hypothetical protein
MTTKPPSTVKASNGGSIESLAYASVKDLPTAEPHDRDRLGYNVWRWLTLKKDPLEVVVKTAGARLLIPEEEAVGRIRENLTRLGVTL